MSIKNEYLTYRDSNNLKTGNFGDRVKLQNYLRENLEKIWDENPIFSNGGLLTNYMTGYALGFSYYDCRPSSFCNTRCYGLPISGQYDYNMLRLSVITSESFKTGDRRYLNVLYDHLRKLHLSCLKIGHWGDAVLEQVQHVADLVRTFSYTTFWWYTRKQEVAIAANELDLPNLKAYLSLDPKTEYPSESDYPFGITYLLGDGHYHRNHNSILKDKRFVAIFPLKKGIKIESPADISVPNHPKLCIEKKWKVQTGAKSKYVCLSCKGHCNYTKSIRTLTVARSGLES